MKINRRLKHVFLIFVILLATIPLNLAFCQNTCNFKFDKEYSRKVKGYVDELNEMFDNDMSNLSAQVTNRIKNDLLNGDYCNKVHFQTLSALSYVFMGMTDSASIQIIKSKSLAKRCLCKSFADFYISQAEYYKANSENDLLNADKSLTINIAAAEELNDGGKIVLNYSDNGPGVTLNQGASDNKNMSLGVKLIELLKAQLENDYIIAF